MRVGVLLSAFIVAGLVAVAWAGAGATDSPLVALLTDYGSADPYAGILKGAILRACPEARLVDITHEIPAFDVRAGARALALAAREFPPGTIFVAIVDPGVGTSRRPIVALTRDNKLFVAPDNGVLTLVVDEMGLREARVVENPRLVRPAGLSSTFHGRDVFGPVAGHLAAGVQLSEVGPLAGELVRLEFPVASVADGVIRGEVDRTDTYGNLLTNVNGELLAKIGISPGDTLIVRLGTEERLFPLVRTYADVAVGDLLAVVASAGELELAMNQGSLAAKIGARSGTPVEVRRARPRK